MGSEVRRFFIESRERLLSRRDVVKRGQRKGKVAENMGCPVGAVKAAETPCVRTFFLFQSLRDDVDILRIL